MNNIMKNEVALTLVSLGHQTDTAGLNGEK